MLGTERRCPRCGQTVPKHHNPLPTVDIIIELEERGVVLIKRRNPPRAWALPGGFVDYGESLESAAVREAKEETSLDIALVHQLHTYSDPNRDPRHHTITTAYVARATGRPVAADDAQDIGVFTEQQLPKPLAFDHARILSDYYAWKQNRLPQFSESHGKSPEQIT